MDAPPVDHERVVSPLATQARRSCFRKAMRTCTLLLGALAAAYAIKTSHGAAVVHGTMGRDASLSLLKRRLPVGDIRCDLFVRESTTRAVISACIALRHADSYSIVQLREDGASLYVCRVKHDGVHRVAAILSTSGATPVRALKQAAAWHHSVFPHIKLCM